MVYSVLLSALTYNLQYPSCIGPTFYAIVYFDLSADCMHILILYFFPSHPNNQEFHPATQVCCPFFSAVNPPRLLRPILLLRQYALSLLLLP